ncbi:MAG: hypothetical protein HYU52_03620 [Acidobacteria bacterium]|nr:hypothetical protein [Acidobacteriota bacterium]
MIQTDTFSYHRVERPEDDLPADPRYLDIAVLDMNHGWHNLGHDAVVQHLRHMANEIVAPLADARLAVRVISYDVRRSLLVPKPGRFRLLIGTGGPGHLDPRENDGIAEWSQGIDEDPAWEAPLWKLFDSVLDDESAALIAICHSYGLACRWSRVAEPVHRDESRGGKSAGVVSNVLTDDAKAHPFFVRMLHCLPEGNELRVTDNRLFDLVELPHSVRNGYTRLSYEQAADGTAGDALTMVEFARDRDGVMPRFLGVNHHPEVIGRNRIKAVIAAKWERGEVTRDWYEDRLRTLDKHMSGEFDEAIRITSVFTFLAPVEFYLHRMLRERREALGLFGMVDENLVIVRADSASVKTSLTE